MKALQSYTAFSYAQSLTTDERIILIDEPLQSEIRMEMEKLETVDGHGLVFFEDTWLTTQLEEILKEIIKDDQTLLVFPGNGSNYPRKLSQFCREFPSVTSVEASRW